MYLAKGVRVQLDVIKDSAGGREEARCGQQQMERRGRRAAAVLTTERVRAVTTHSFVVLLTEPTSLDRQVICCTPMTIALLLLLRLHLHFHFHLHIRFPLHSVVTVALTESIPYSITTF